MKTVPAVLVGMFIVFGIFLAAPTSPAHETPSDLVLYDDFSEAKLDAGRWRGVQRIAVSLPGGTGLEMIRGIDDEELRLSHRVVGGIGAPLTGRTDNRNRVFFVQDPIAIIAVKFDVEVTDFDLLDCGGPPSEIVARFNSILFRDPDTPANGSFGAIVQLSRNSTSTDRRSVLRATGALFRCEESLCRNSDVDTVTVSVVDLGPVERDEEVTLRMSWTPLNLLGGGRVDFQKGKEAIQSLFYGGPPFNITDDTQLRDFRTLEVIGLASNCTAEPRAFAEINATFRNVFVDFDF